MLGMESRQVRSKNVRKSDHLTWFGEVTEIEVNGKDGKWFDEWLPEGYLRFHTPKGQLDRHPRDFIEAVRDNREWS